MARQPSAADNIRNNMILTAALVEGVALIAEVVAFLIIFLK
jgi:F-type H+-transporting ATPase subunit c